MSEISSPVSDCLLMQACADILRRRLDKAVSLLRRCRSENWLGQKVSLDVAAFLKEEDDARNPL